MNKILKKYGFNIIFLFTNILFIFLLIYKKTTFSHLNYEKQKLDNNLEDLVKEKQKLEQELLIIKEPRKIQRFAQKKLGMQKVKISQVKKI
ncbi:hypothetical protein A3F66_01055 [candidate division TM6 bacterium RIFCSPHIGHO2_12_FULL_32_22]|nr:MAG: hypothetical protein A3F66_01055 [candidate division TM6 bacterium RIFCSPHIGHO2_12_FULL_32_22]